jgi:hypothetical protein
MVRSALPIKLNCFTGVSPIMNLLIKVTLSTYHVFYILAKVSSADSSPPRSPIKPQWSDDSPSMLSFFFSPSLSLYHPDHHTTTTSRHRSKKGLLLLRGNIIPRCCISVQLGVWEEKRKVRGEVQNHHPNLSLPTTTIMRGKDNRRVNTTYEG